MRNRSKTLHKITLVILQITFTSNPVMMRHMLSAFLIILWEMMICDCGRSQDISVVRHDARKLENLPSPPQLIAACPKSTWFKYSLWKSTKKGFPVHWCTCFSSPEYLYWISSIDYSNRPALIVRADCTLMWVQI